MTGIEWTDKTWNPIRGCSVVSAGCENCYAMRQAHRFSGYKGAYEGLTRMTRRGPKWTGEVRLVPELLAEPLRWRKPYRVFVNSMSDLFHEEVPFRFVDEVFAVMGLSSGNARWCSRMRARGCHQTMDCSGIDCTIYHTPRKTFQILTKRPERMRQYLSDPGVSARVVEAAHGFWMPREATIDAFNRSAWPLPNVHLGVSVENQETADERIPELLETPAAVRFVSCEPLLGLIDLDEDEGNWLHVHPYMNDAGDGYEGKHEDRRLRCDVCDGQTVIDWVIVGGESGPGARPCNVEWIRSIVTQCGEAKVPVFVKQLGSRPAGVLRGHILEDRKGGDPSEWPEDLRVREFPESLAGGVDALEADR